MIGGDRWIKKKVNYISCIGKGSLKDIHCNTQNTALKVSLHIIKHVFAILWCYQ